MAKGGTRGTKNRDSEPDGSNKTHQPSRKGTASHTLGADAQKL